MPHQPSNPVIAERAARLGLVANQIRRDVTDAVRALRRSPGFTAGALATLALGIGANTAIFSIVDTVVFRPLPYTAPERLVKIYDGRSAEPTDNVSLADFLDLRERGGVFVEVAADDAAGFAVTHPGGERELLGGAMVTTNWLSTLGVRPILGRPFLEDESLPGRNRVVLLSHSYWQRRFDANPDAIGRTFHTDDGPFVTVGVLPPNVLRYGADFITPLVAAQYPAGRDHGDLDIVARLGPGTTLAQAQARVDSLSRLLEQEHPATNRGRRFRLAPLDKYYASIQTHAPRGLLLVLGAVALVLLIACTNVANLFLVRVGRRSREYVIRSALGASRARLVSHLLVENLILFVAGGALGLIVAHWSVDWATRLAIAGDYVPERMTAALDARVFAFTLAVSLVAGLSFGLVPALQASRLDLARGLKASGLTFSGELRRRRASRLLIVAEIALSVVLLVGGGLLARSLLRLHSTSGGFEPERLLMTASDGGRSFAPAVAYWRAALEQARRHPGVDSAAVSSRPPMHGVRRQRFELDSGPGLAPQGDGRAGDVLVSADYFRTMEIPVQRGRPFTERDDASAPPVIIVSERLARAFFPDGNPLGRRLRIDERLPMTCCSSGGPVEGVWREIVGVVGDIRQGNLDEAPAMTMYRPYSQIVEHDMYLMVRTRAGADMGRVVRELPAQLLAIDTGKWWLQMQPMRQVIDWSGAIRLRRFMLVLLGCFAGLALLLAAIGTFGVLAHAVAERTTEIGIRMALGATRPVILANVLAESLALTAVGLAAGAAAAYLLSGLLGALLFEIDATDAPTYLCVSLLLVLVALLASYVPARRATRVDPISALRHL